MSMQPTDPFVDAPRPAKETLSAYIAALPKLGKKERRKLKKAAAKRNRQEARIERRLRAEDPGKGYQIRFNRSDTKSFYEDRCVLPAAAVWNMDEFLMTYLAEGIEALLQGPTDWNYSIDGKKPSTAKKLKKVVRLCREQVAATRDGTDSDAGNKALRILAEIGVGRLWD